MKTFLISAAVAALILTASTAFAAADEPHSKGNNSSHATGQQQEKPPKGNTGGTGTGKGNGQTGQTRNLNATGGGRSGGMPSTSSGHHHNATGGMMQGNTSGGNAPSGNTSGRNLSGRNGQQGQSQNGKGSNGNGQQGQPAGSKGQGGNAWGHHGSLSAAINLRHFHKNMRATRRFRIGSYHGPHGYHYRRWAYGMFLPEIYFAQDYWISDYEDYDLDDPPDGYVWVRYGPDALLLDEDTGEIVEVEYGVFY